jgi:murein DD-endopeptidase MepM/ murein hydrolase activator NlpD
MKYTTRAGPPAWFAAAALALALVSTSPYAWARDVKGTHAHSGKPTKSGTTTKAKLSSKSGKTKLAGKANAGKAAKATKGHRVARSRGPTIVRMPSPPAAELAELKEAKLQTACLELPLNPGVAASFGLTPDQVDTLVQAQNGVSSGRCAPFAAVTTAGANLVPTSYAFLPGDDGRAMVVTPSLEGSIVSTQWRNIDGNAAGPREIWLSTAKLNAASADTAENLPPHLQHELSVMVRQMRKQPGISDNAVVRALIEGDGDEASLTAVELVDTLTGQALDSVVWLARSDEPGAFISVRGVELERLLWQSPLDYRRISRGIGASSMLVHKKVRVKLKSKKGRVRTKLVVQAFRYESQHVGIDFAADTGTPVVAVANGVIAFSGRRGGYGNLVIVQHGPELTTYYAHLSAFAPNLQEGMRVRRGQEIGLVGSTGFSTGPHLHFEIRKGAKYMDPTHADQRLPVWTLLPHEHVTVLTLLLQLEKTRGASLQRMAHAPAAAPFGGGQ